MVTKTSVTFTTSAIMDIQSSSAVNRDCIGTTMEKFVIGQPMQDVKIQGADQPQRRLVVQFIQMLPALR